MRNFAVITTLLVIALFAVPLGAAATGGGDSAAATATCPLPSGPGSYVVDISNELMWASDAGKSTAGPVSFALPAGTWDVYLVSYDDHSNKTHQTQLEEQWFLQGWLGESIVFTSPTTPDLPDTTDVKEFFVGSLTSAQAIDKVLAVHAAYPSGAPHSVAPLCAAFYPTGTSPVAPVACPLPAGPGVVTISTEPLLAWDAATAMAGPVDFVLPAGTWEVLLVSYDNHSAKTHQAQKMEQWYLQGWLNGAVVFQTNPTGDLPEDLDYAAFPVGSITTASAIDQVKAFHYAYPSDEPHSVAPLCASFVATGSTPEGTKPSKDDNGDNGDTTGGGDNGDTTGGGDNGDTTGGGDNGDTTGDTGTSNSNQTGTTVAAGLEGNTAQTLQQLPLTGIELETAFAAIVALMFGVVLLRRARLWQTRLERRAARVWRRQLS
jgi:hypothetical protein